MFIAAIKIGKALTIASLLLRVDSFTAQDYSLQRLPLGIALSLGLNQGLLKK
jgi:hypothetical protein